MADLSPQPPAAALKPLILRGGYRAARLPLPASLSARATVIKVPHGCLLVGKRLAAAVAAVCLAEGRPELFVSGVETMGKSPSWRAAVKSRASELFTALHPSPGQLREFPAGMFPGGK